MDTTVMSVFRYEMRLDLNVLKRLSKICASVLKLLVKISSYVFR
jgi:hypothetical protein